MQEFLQLLELVLDSFEVSGSPQAFLVLFLLLFARFASFVYIVPFLGGKDVPTQVKAAVATALVIVTFPSVSNEIPVDGSALGFGPVGFVAMLAKEVFVGFTLGFVASVIFQAVLVAGRIIDIQRGATMAELLEPQTKDYVSHLGTFKTQLAIVVFIAIGAHRFFVSALVRSFEVIPVTKFPKFEAGFNQGIEFITVLSGTVFSIGVQLAIPAVLALLLTDLLFGVIGRVIPEANTFILSMPVKMMMGIFAVAVSLQLVVSLYISYFDDSFKAFEFMIEIFGRLFQ